MRDGTGMLQCVVFKKEVTPEEFDLTGRLAQESSVVVSGVVRADARAPLGYELGVTHIELVHEAAEYPITPKEHGVAFLLDHRHLWVRSARQHAILRIRSELVHACRRYFDERGFVLFDAPILTPAACEGTTTLFETPYFDDKAYLTQSGQLYLEAGALAFGKVYCFGPTFRAEKSKTRRHLIEFWMVEPEVAYMDLAGDMDLAEDFVEYVVQRVVEKRRAELETLERDLSALERVRKPFPRITYGEAIDILKSRGSAVEWGADFGAEDETLLSEAFDRPVLVHRYPAQCKAFYMKADPPTRAWPCASTCSPRRATARSSAAASARTTRKSCSAGSGSTGCRRRPSTGTSTCAVTAPCRTPASAWASSASWPGCAACTTCARPSPSRACSSACAPDGDRKDGGDCRTASRPCRPRRPCRPFQSAARREVTAGDHRRRRCRNSPCRRIPISTPR